ncbi:MAG: SDR family NAD(P)-dependent oxidoreductase [Helicobacteraceae bacterium]|nr:SDR family NAD(P)-dependent oxidoreductase [Helicobacteraceae bacterium]
MITFNKEQIYIVTGASSGIGKAVALLLNELGASVIAIARDKERLESMRAESKNPNNIYIEIKDLCELMGGGIAL